MVKTLTQIRKHHLEKKRIYLNEKFFIIFCSVFFNKKGIDIVHAQINDKIEFCIWKCFYGHGLGLF